jgi:hypothetical protein
MRIILICWVCPVSFGIAKPAPRSLPRHALNVARGARSARPGPAERGPWVRVFPDVARAVVAVL